MKQYLIFSLSIVSSFLLFLIQVGHITWVNALIHLIVISCLIALQLSLLLPLTHYANRGISFITTLLVFSGYAYLVTSYISFYIALENWGHPMTIPIFKTYTAELLSLSANLPWSLEIVYTSAILFFGMILLISANLTRKIVRDLNKWGVCIFQLRPLGKLTILSIAWICLIGLLNWSYFIRVIRYKSNLPMDPVLSLYFYRNSYNPKVLDGFDQLKSKNNYPSNLSFNKKNVILIICDALRADHIGAYGYKRPTTPFLDSLVSEPNSLILENYYATSSFSFTGIINTLSSDYKIRTDQFFVHDLLRKQGYKVNFILGGDHTNFYGLRKSYGESLDFYEDGFTTVNSVNEDHFSVNDDLLVLKYINELKDYSGVPNFFYLHFMSVHQAGVAQAKYEKYFPNVIEGFELMDSVNLINDYDNRLSQLDDYLRMCIASLKLKGYLDNATLIITGDHGQALMERGRYWHSKSTEWSEINIPFIMVQTGDSIKKLVRKEQLANQLDVAPTVLDLLGLKQPEVWLGRSIFKNDSRDWIFQQQRDFYSVIWVAEDNITYQYSFNSRLKNERAFRLTHYNVQDVDPSTVPGVDKARLAIKRFFDI